VEEPTPRAGAHAPRGVADLANDVENLSDADGYPAHVRVVEVPGEHGSAWLVEVSGTQVWDPHAGSNPFDVTSDARLMAQESTVLAGGVQQALAQAQAASGRDACDDPVLLAGHSLGGIVAAGLAASPRFREAHRVTHIVTLGSPVARMPVPASVSVLSLEHTQDVVPRLDGLANPDRRGWVTVTRDLHRDADGVSTASVAHGLGEYARTGAAVDASPDQSLQAWRDGTREFFEPAPGSVAVVRDFRVARGGVSPVGASP
jgi:pimeloyl-ACP methyl ester carboxylesterase